MSRCCGRLFFYFCWLSTALLSPAAERGTEMLNSLRQMAFDPARCYRVHEIAFQRGDAKLYLTAGHLLFAKPVAGRMLAAVFLADVEAGDAEVLLLPPTRVERQSLAQYIQTPNLDAHFGAALFLFTDDTGRVLEQRVRETDAVPTPDRGMLMREAWDELLHRLTDGFQLRLAQDLLSGHADQQGFFFGALQTVSNGNLEILSDPSAPSQMLVGQSNTHQNTSSFDVWTTFPSRAQRQKGEPPPVDMIESIRLDAEIDDALHLKVKTRATLTPAAGGEGVLTFELARRLRVTAARIDGQPAEVLQRDEQREEVARDRESEAFLVVPAQPLAPGRPHEVEIEHEGNVIVETGRQIYFVNARTTWYPRQRADYSRYELNFRYPARFDLVATGDRVEEKTEGAFKTSRYRTTVPVRQVGFNLGVYDETEVKRPPYTVEVFANKRLEAALQPRDTVVVPGSRPGSFGRPPRPGSAAPGDMVATVTRPVSLRESMADDIADSLAFMASRFGPLPWKRLTVSPVPAAFGQGFPGLIYLSTLAYMRHEDRPSQVQTDLQNVFFTELLQAHETAHQWWGNTVVAATPEDDWLMEALANYSALLYVEKKKGPAAVDKILASYREDLLHKTAAGKTLESSGPVIWGGRLRQTGEPDAWRVITYEKGSWIMHMLRRRLGDERFFALLSDLRQKFSSQPLSTAAFQQAAQRFLPADAPEKKLDGFFEQWVYGTGIPVLKIQSSVKGAAPQWRVTGTVQQSDVDEDFSMAVPVEITTSRNTRVVKWISTSSEPVPFAVNVPQQPVKVQLDPGNSTLHR